jgi:hypothetical protein
MAMWLIYMSALNLSQKVSSITYIFEISLILIPVPDRSTAERALDYIYARAGDRHGRDVMRPLSMVPAM